MFLKNLLYFVKIIFSIKFIIKKKNILILGNSKIIKSKKIGKYIDKNFNIVRINFPPRKEFYDYVGKNTYIQTVNDEILFNKKNYNNLKFKEFRINNKQIYFFFTKKKINNLKISNYLVIDPKKISKVLLCIVKIFLLRNNKVYFKNTDNFEFSSGMITLLLLYFANKKIIFWGFDEKKSNQNYNYYHNRRKKNLEDKHYFLIENQILKKLKRFKIYFK